MPKNELDLLSVGEWKLGQNSVQAENNAVFQLPNPQALFPQDTIPQLVKAYNVDLDNNGVPTRRDGFTELASVSSGKTTFAGAGLLLVQDGGTLYKVNTSTGALTSLVTGLSSSLPIKYLDYLDQIWWTNTEQVGRITSSGTSTNWGCTIAPTPSLTAVSGDLPEGRYLVSATFVDGNGIEHGASKAAAITLNGSQDIQVALSAIDSNASTVKLYVTRPNGRELYFSREVAANTLPTNIVDESYSKEPLRTFGLSPPITGDRLFDYRGFIIITADNYLFPSQGVNHHLFDLTTDLEGRPTNIIGGVGLNNGFWTICEDGAYWTTGAIPSEWETVKVDNFKYAGGGIKVPGYMIPEANTPDPVAVFVSEYGLMLGLPAGNMRPLTKDRLHLNVLNKESKILLRTKDEYNQILFSVV